MLFLSERQKCNRMVETTGLEIDRSEGRSRESNMSFLLGERE